MGVQTPDRGHSYLGRELSDIPARAFGAEVIPEGNGLTLAPGTLQTVGGGWGSLTPPSPLCAGCGLFLPSCLPADGDKG